jgi:hypothetical protein
MVSMWVMELSLIEVIDVIAMWKGLVSAFVMSTGTSSWSTTSRILVAYRDGMFIIVSSMG